MPKAGAGVNWEFEGVWYHSYHPSLPTDPAPRFSHAKRQTPKESFSSGPMGITRIAALHNAALTQGVA